MCVGKTYALRGELINVGCGDFSAFGVVALHVAVAEVVCVDEYDVRFLCGDERKDECGC